MHSFRPVLSVSTLRSPFFFFNDTATTEIYTLSLHDALPISPRGGNAAPRGQPLVLRGSQSATPRVPRRTPNKDVGRPSGVVLPLVVGTADGRRCPTKRA